MTVSTHCQPIMNTVMMTDASSRRICAVQAGKAVVFIFHNKFLVS